jgi:hypothetical protein
MAAPTKAQLATARDLLARADRRINGAAKAARRPSTDPGEFDNNFDGVVTAIFHIVDAYELATTGIKRRVGEAEQATRIESVLIALRAAKTPMVPPGSRLIGLNARRNTSVHGEWVEVLDPDALEDAIRAARELLSAVRHLLAAKGIDVS